VLLIYGGWHPHYGNYGDIWAAKLDAWDTSDSSGSGIGERAREADRRFSQILGSPDRRFSQVLSSPMAAANGGIIAAAAGMPPIAVLVVIIAAVFFVMMKK
jgi:hypothetical protein